MSTEPVSGMDRVSQELQELNHNVATIAQTTLEILRPAVEVTRQIATDLYESSWSAYRAAGAPYGESDDGLQSWLHDLAEIQRLENLALAIQQRHQSLISSRAALMAQRQAAKHD